jgi:23S rRNA pseudouridine1911/1915/1917 synthase
LDLNILHEDNHIIVAVKPPKVPSQRDKSRDIDMLTIIGEHIKKQHPNVNKPYVGLIHRLDRPVGGVMVFAKTKYANTKLSEQIRNKQIKKQYKTVVCGSALESEKEVVDYLVKQRNNVSKVVSKDTNNAKEAILKYKGLKTDHTEEYGELSLLNVELITGRHHQIRVQLSNANLPIWGDTKYNSEFMKRKGWFQIALFAYKLSFKHPKTNKELEFVAESNEYPFSVFKEGY